MDSDDKAQKGTASAWLDALDRCKQDEWHRVCDSIDKLYADLNHLSQNRADREMQIFWANLEVLKPSVYSRPPVPVVTPRFRERRDLPRKAADILERALVMDAEDDDLHDTLMMVRDDLCLAGRGVAWLRLADADEGQEVIAEHVERKDWRCSKARKWKEVTWVARRSYMTREAGEERFGEKFREVPIKRREDEDTDKGGKQEASVWEIWSKRDRKLYFVAEGGKDILDEADPPFDVYGFFPCPRPAFATVQRATLTPVPDFVYYKDQIEEINELTARISALTESLRVKGFYPAGAADAGEAIQTALRATDNRSIMVPVPSFQSLERGASGGLIEWLPVDQVATVITSSIAIRRQLIEDIYQVTGLSDIMRGDTNASETLGAQQLKSQYGSVRIRDKQGEMVRLARDVIRLKAEIMAEHFEGPQLLAMSQVDDIPSQADIEAQYQQAVMMAQQQGQEPPPPPDVVTIEAIMGLLRDQRVRPFVLEVETDSTIMPDENAEKQRRAEFLTAIGGFIGQAAGLVQADPAAAPMAAEMLKFAAAAFRADRTLDTAIDEYAEQLRIRAEAAQGQEQQPDPAQEAAAMEAQIKQAEMQMKQAEMQAKMQEAAQRAQVDMAKVQMEQQAMGADLAKTQAEIEKLKAETDKIRAESGHAMADQQFEQIVREFGNPLEGQAA